VIAVGWQTTSEVGVLTTRAACAATDETAERTTATAKAMRITD